MKPVTTIKRIGLAFFELIYPDLCIICQSESKSSNGLFCVHCLSKLPFIHFNHAGNKEFCDHFGREFNLVFGTGIFHLNPGSGIAKLIYGIKYQDQVVMAKKTGSFIGDLFLNTEYELDFDIIVPVPLHEKKLRKRGYNQSEIVANGLGKRLGIEVNTRILKRIKNTDTQTKLKRGLRLKNTKDAFKMSDQSLKENSHILLVDDVLTTGSTLKDCARALLSVQNIRISMLTIAMGE
jgi:ComF family protein